MYHIYEQKLSRSETNQNLLSSLHFLHSICQCGIRFIGIFPKTETKTRIFFRLSHGGQNIKQKLWTKLFKYHSIIEIWSLHNRFDPYLYQGSFCKLSQKLLRTCCCLFFFTFQYSFFNYAQRTMCCFLQKQPQCLAWNQWRIHHDAWYFTG